jgi:hypothetical protein
MVPNVYFFILYSRLKLLLLPQSPCTELEPYALVRRGSLGDKTHDQHYITCSNLFFWDQPRPRKVSLPRLFPLPPPNFYIEYVRDCYGLIVEVPQPGVADPSLSYRELFSNPVKTCLDVDVITVEAVRYDSSILDFIS